MIVRCNHYYSDSIMNDVHSNDFDVNPEIESGGWIIEGDEDKFVEWAENEGVDFEVVE